MYYRTRSPIGILISLLVSGIIAGVVYWKVNGAFDKATAVESSIIKSTGGLTQDPSVTATSPTSLYKAANLHKAIKLAEAKYGAEITVSLMKVQPSNIYLTTNANGGDLIGVSSAGQLSEEVTGGASSADDSVDITKIDAQAPVRMLAQMGIPSTKVDYFTFTPFGTSVQWEAFTNDSPPEMFRANAHGRKLVKF